MKILTYSFLCLAFLLCYSCNKDDDKSQPDVLKITSIWPAYGTANTIVTINGKEFSNVRENNKVSFNNIPAIVIEASETQLQVVSPEGGSTGNVNIEVGGQQFMGPVYSYTLPPEEYFVETYAGTGGTAGSVEGSLKAAKFRNPEGLSIDLLGNLYIADRGNNRIRKISGGMVSAYAGKDQDGHVDGDVSIALFDYPWKTAVDKSGNVYVADRDNHSVRKITPEGIVSTLAGSGSAGYADGNGTAAKFNQPLDVATDDAGNVYVADNLNHRIRKIDPAGNVTTLAGSGTAGYADGTGTAASFKNPSGLCVDKDGNIFVADRLNHRVRKIGPGAEVTTVAGDGYAGFVDGLQNNARFNGPYGIDVDANGALYIADLSNNKIRKIKDGSVSTIAGTSNGYLDGAGGGAQFSQPTDVCVDPGGNIFVADLGNHVIRKLYRK
ncbi:gluconolactonase [Chitinophaga caeni]|uniref:Gluconolactonase n=1 Tax=Chitinophaga caeni TaxID=2029983 RepID=A0A291QVB8_9BACT|nr:IPT/TIG domain-containing protein [Chitinophaga caeni]ATL47794.1 gluconolactonase [Chitinophaga caeni]